MITRVLIATVAGLFVAPFAFGQMKYSRTRSQSPTPTPSPSSTPPQQKMAPAQTQLPTTSPRTVSSPRTAPSPRDTPMLIHPKEMSTAGAPVQPRTAGARPLIQPKPTPALALIPPKTATTPAPMPAKPTPTPVPPPDVKAYLDKQVASSKDQKFHMTMNGKDLALTPFHVWSQKTTGPNTTSTCIDMRSDEGSVYDIDFLTTGAQVSSIRIHRVNGEAVR
ncbi:MAG TPA: hypothetical protein VNX27_05825 [Chthoniobacterales bacterium]|nr:hypothetical protein [Chthoniobacterales bacterium]